MMSGMKQKTITSLLSDANVQSVLGHNSEKPIAHHSTRPTILQP